ncbi:TonB-dependent receptor [Stenotrophomonas sp. MYb238]|uniref:TonB-dependent receptor plug domain-containing protein n=1 Tax=Stenotrophomonas sp. MYb238 TaxID=2040281 RepID=UPI001291120A|nr:TonB-dependent receptor [Stenotrophomonas sp. MYb238]MQP75660.1 TonB-dependent receptor [Stenotrophomonas sp. MYb238]
MYCKSNKLRDAVVLALVAGAAGTTGAAFAQDAEGATNLDRIEVTGSRIKRVDVEGPSPVTVISRQDIETAGEISVADFLRNNVYNSFGSVRESSGSATGSQATISLRGLGSEYTLVLLDGRRMTKSAALDGGSANINLIPTAAVERIEILREGAGAVYGSDAIGGVVNVILRKDYEGLSFSAGYESPKIGPNGRTGSIAGGISSDRGNVTFVLDHQEREMMYNREIKNLITGAGLTWGTSAFNSSANFFSPSTGLVGVANCDTFENSIRTSPTTCGFDHGATSANEASLSRDSLLVNSNYQLTDNTSFFFRAIASDTKSVGVYASAPVDSYPTIAADNPYNPFGVDGTLYYRFTPLGTRDAIRKDSYRDYSFGLQGNIDLFGKSADWEVFAGHGRVSQSSVNYNYGLSSALQAAIDSGSYNPFDPTSPSVAAAAPSVGHTVYVENEQRTVNVGGNISFDLFEIGGRPAGFVTGFEYLDDRLKMVYDAQSAAGNVFGSAGAGSGGSRASYAAYFETLLPLLDTLSLTLAGRYDSYNDVGSKFSPRASFEFRPFESLLVRGSWGKGFRAPTLPDLYGAPSTTNLSSPPLSSAGHPGGDELACKALQAVQATPGNANYQPYPVDPCTSKDQYQWLVSSNPFLKPEESENWGVGFVWSPMSNLSFAVDYYDVKLENVISTVPRALAFRYGDQGVPGYGVDRTANIVAPNGAILPGVAQQILLPIDNGALQTVRGVDVEASYRFETDAAGNFTTKLSWSHQLEFDFTAIASDKLERGGTAGYPKDRAQLMLGWDKGDFNAAVITNYISDSSNGTPATSLPSWTTFDVQASVALPWNGKVTLGVRNLGNKMPPFNSTLYSFPYYDNDLYNIWGRTPYIRYEQNF